MTAHHTLYILSGGLQEPKIVSEVGKKIADLQINFDTGKFAYIGIPSA